MVYDPSCHDYPCLNPHCRYDCCQSYQYKRQHIHPLHRRHHVAHVSSSAVNEAQRRLRRASALAREIDKQERQAENDKPENEAKQKVEDIARGKAEREKDAEHGKKSREKAAERKAKEEADADSDWEWVRCGSYWRRLREREVLVLDGDFKRGKYLERRNDSRAGVDRLWLSLDSA